MTIYLRQSTASQEVPLGYFVDSTDGNTEKTALTIANTDIKLWKTGATTLANKNSGGATHISNGVYYAVLDATDTDTIGSMVIFVHVSGALTIRLECLVLDEAVYDTMFGTTALSTYAGGAVASVTAGVTVTTNNDKTGYALSSAGVQAIWDALTSALTTANSIGKLLVDNINATISSRLASASISLSGGAVTVGTNNDKTGYTASTVSDKTGYSLSSAGVQAIWDALTSALTTASSIGKLLVDNINATISSRLASASITLSGGAVTVGTNNDKTGYTLSAAGVQAVWDALTSALTTASSIGKLLVDNINATISSRLASASITLSGGSVTVGTNSDKTGYTLSSAGIQAIWDALTSALTTVGSIGKRIVDNLDAAVSTRSSHTAADVWAAATRTLTAGVTVTTNNDKTGYSLAAGQLSVKKNTALSNFEFLMRASSDHSTPATGLTVTAQCSIDGAAFTACTNSVSEVANGIYKINLAAADLNGTVITFKFTATGADARYVTVVTQA